MPARDSAGRFTGGGGSIPAGRALISLGIDPGAIIGDMASIGARLKGMRIGGLVSGISGSIGNVLSGLQSIALKTGAVFGGVSSAFQFIGRLGATAASDFAETISKFNTVMGDSATSTREWAEQFASAANRSKASIVTLLAEAQDFFVPMGIARDEAAEMSKTLVKLATDVGSFANLDTTDAFRKLISGIQGQTEAVRSMGIDISDTTLKQFALTQGITQSWASVTQSTKLLLRMNKAIMDSKDAMDDATKTAGSWSNTLRGVRGNFQDLLIAIGKPLIGTDETAGLLTPYLKTLQEVVKATAIWIEQNPKFIAQMFEIAKVVFAVTTLAGLMASALGTAVIAAQPFGLVFAGLAKAATDLGWINLQLGEIRKTLDEFIEPIEILGRALFVKLKIEAAKFASYLAGKVISVMEDAEEWFGTVWDRISGMVSDWGTLVKHTVSAVVAFGIAEVLQAAVALAEHLPDFFGIGKVTQGVRDAAAKALQDVATKELKLAGKEIDRPDFDTPSEALQDIVKDLDAFVAREGSGADEDLKGAFGGIKDLIGRLQNSLALPGGTKTEFDPTGGLEGVTKNRITGFFGGRDVAELLGAPSSPQKMQLDEAKKTNRLLEKVVDNTAQGATPQPVWS